MAAIAESSKVAYKFLGRSGVKVSNICLGTMTFGQAKGSNPVQCDEELAHKILNRFVEWGGNFIDTADVYQQGVSESMLGTWLKKQERDRFIIATKVRGNFDPTDPNGVGLSRKHIMAGIENSLKRLQTDYVDLYQMHVWDDGTPIKETLLAFNDLVRCGKVRYVGASNVTGWQMQKIMDLGREMGLSPFISLQPQYNLLCRQTEWELGGVCKEEGLGILPWSPLKGGLLTGKFTRGQTPTTDTRIGYAAQDEAKFVVQSRPSWSKADANDGMWKLLDEMATIARVHDKSVPQVAIRWLLQKPEVSSVIIGAKTLAQLDDNMGAANGWCMTEQEMQTLDDLSEPEIPYPYEMIFRINKGRSFHHGVKAPM